MKNEKQRILFCLIDGIIAGENKGPLSPDEKREGCLIGGENPLAVDMTTARLIGFDINKIKQFKLSNYEKTDYTIKSLSEIEIALDNISINGDYYFNSNFNDKLWDFVPHPGWTGHIEI